MPVSKFKLANPHKGIKRGRDVDIENSKENVNKRKKPSNWVSSSALPLDGNHGTLDDDSNVNAPASSDLESIKLKNNQKRTGGAENVEQLYDSCSGE